MLIGIMASVAMDVRQREKADYKFFYLRIALKNILECYIHDDGRISRNEFGLIIKNADIHHILEYFGASVQNLASMEESLYAKTEHITFDSMFETISNLVETKHCTVRDAFHVQDALQRSLHSIESRLVAAGFHRPL